MPVLQIADFAINLLSALTTSPALAVMSYTGQIYYADAHVGECPNSLKITDGENVWTIGSRELYWQATTFDTCESVTLVPGCYTVEVLGENGGQGGNNTDSPGSANAQVFSFSVTTETVGYALRGSDGNAGLVNSNGSVYSGGGGGSSGVPSFFQVGSNFVISDGGAGASGGGGYNSSGVEQSCGAGGGGGATDGAAGAASSGFLYNGSAGTGATDSAGGTGGGSSMGGLFGSSNATGGVGGANVAYSCGNQTFYSYGGGGGGAVSTGGLFGVGIGVNGGDGGSGGSEASDVSYVRIYRMGE